MKTINTKAIAFVCGIILATCGGIYTTVKLLQPKTGYVDLVTVYNEFNMKKELDNKLQDIQSRRKNIMDSLTLQLNILGQRAELAPEGDSLRYLYMQQRQYYATQEEQFLQDNSATAQTYQEQIWKQINDYVAVYGKENGYSYIFGADGSGSVMYSEDGNDLTEEMKSYVNAKYEGQ
jgi:outer membrane protein